MREELGYRLVMVRMVPAHGPRSGSDDAVQARLYHALELQLDGDLLVVHAPAWVGQAATGGPCDGRADFLIADPERGLLLLDIVVGGLAVDPSTDQWTDGIGAAVVNPFERISAARDALAELLMSQPTALPVRPVMGHVVVMPDITAPHRGFGATAPRAVIFDMTQLHGLTSAVGQAFDHWAERAPGRGNAAARWWMRVLETTFIAPVSVRARLGGQIARDRDEILALDAQQVMVLEMLNRMRQVTIYGPAGTGKTVLAIAKARSLAAQGRRVLLTCFNKALGAHLYQACSDQSAITAVHFHELCFRLLDLHATAVRLPEQPEQRANFFDEQLPARLIAAASRLPRFDAVVVDEGQDFKPRFWRALEAISSEGRQSIRYIFYDDRQSLDTRREDADISVPGADSALILRTNWRNTRSIHAHIGAFEPPFRDTQCAAPQGVPVWHVRRDGSDPRAALRDVLRRLVLDEGIVASDIVILTGKGRHRSELRDIGGAVAVVEHAAGVSGDAVGIHTIHGFKGLESPVVILAELDHLSAATRLKLHYVGASRAMNLLVIMPSAAVTV